MKKKLNIEVKKSYIRNNGNSAKGVYDPCSSDPCSSDPCASGERVSPNEYAGERVSPNEYAGERVDPCN